MPRYALPRSFPARYASDCEACTTRIEVGDRVIIFGETFNEKTGRVKKAVYHKECLKRFLHKVQQAQAEARGAVPSGRRRVKTRHGWITL